MLLTLSIFAISLQIGIAERTSSSRTYEFTENQVHTYWPNIDNTNLVYARCNTSAVPGSSKECIVGMKFDAFENDTGTSKECKITLKPEVKNGVVNDGLLIRGFGKDKILVVWMEIQNASDAQDRIEWTIFKSTVVHMFDSCHNYEVEVHKYAGHPDIDFQCLHQPNVALFKDNYDIILKDAVNNCTSDPECKPAYGIFKFDSRGRRISGPEHWPNLPLVNGSRYIVSAGFSPPKEGYFISNRNGSNYIVELMDKQSAAHEKLEVWTMSSNNSSREMYRISVTNKAISLSYVSGNSTVGCWQADQQGKIHVKAQFTFQHPYSANIAAMYNMRNGGLLLGVMKYNNNDNNTDWHTHDNYQLVKVDVKGQVESVDVKFDEKCTHDDGTAIIRMIENKKDQFCMVRLCQSNFDKPGRLETSTRCYSTDEFAKCLDCVV